MSRYVFHELIGTGGMGEVWRATDTTLNREVAIKLLKPEHAEDPIGRSRFESEAKHAAALHHPNVVSVYDVGEMPTASGLMRPFLVMELVDHKPLSELIRGGRPLDPEVVRDLLGQAGDALGAAHRAGIVHRDVKPANLLVTPQRQVKVTDFGIARAQASTGITGTGQVMGTPQYLSPEQARGEKATPRSDVYSLGVVMFECLAGHRPFQKETPVATAIAHLHDPVPPLPGNIPEDMRAIVAKCLQKDAALRYEDASSFTNALLSRSERLGGSDNATTMVAPAAPVAGATAVMAPVPSGPPSRDTYGQGPGGPGPGPLSLQGRPEGPGGPGGPPQRYQDPYDRREPYGDEPRPWYRNPFNIIVIVLLLAVVIAVIVVAKAFGGSGDAPTDTASTTTSAAATQSSPAAEDTPTEDAKKPVVLDEGKYLGSNVDDVNSELRDLGLVPHVKEQDNDGTHEEDTVASISPTENVFEGDTVTVRFYGPKPQPTETPTPTDQPTDGDHTGAGDTPPTDQPTDGFSIPGLPGGGDTTGPGNGKGNG